MAHSAIVFNLTAVWRSTETPFVERCRAIEPVIDNYLGQGSPRHEGDRLSQGRRLLQAAGLGGALGPHFGAHVVRRTVFNLAQSSPRFIAARHLLEQMGQWPSACPAERELWHIPVNRCRDEWALQLAASRKAKELTRLSLRWQAMQLVLRPPAKTHEPASLTPAEQCRLLAIAHYWSGTFGDAAAHAAAHLLPPSAVGLDHGTYCAQARRIVAIWSEIKLPQHESDASKAKRTTVAIWPRRRKPAAGSNGSS